jgi:hypothetical protein
LVHTDEEFEELRADNAYWRQAYIDLELKKDTKAAELEHEFAWLKDLNANQWLSGDQKVVLWEIRCIMRRLRYDLSEPVHIWLSEIENRTGLSSGAIKKITDQLHQFGLITKDTRGKGKGQKTWFSIGGTIRQSVKDVVVHSPKHNRGGLRCPRCQSENIQPTSYKCLDCKHEWHA